MVCEITVLGILRVQQGAEEEPKQAQHNETSVLLLGSGFECGSRGW